MAKIGACARVHGSGDHSGKLLFLAVKGNYFIERHPDYKALIIRHFANLKELDSMPIGQGQTPGGISLKSQVTDGQRLKHFLIPFLMKLDKNVMILQHRV